MHVKRGVLILEEGLSALESPLKSRNFWVHMISAVAAHQQMDLLVHRVLITEPRKGLQSQDQVLLHALTEPGAHWHEPALMELGLGDEQGLLSHVDVANAQAEGLSMPQAQRVQHGQHQMADRATHWKRVARR